MNLEEILAISDTSVSITKTKPENVSDAKVRRFKEISLFVTTIALLIGTGCFCGIIVWTSLKTNSALSGIALNGMIGISLGLGGYVLRGKQKD